MRPTHALEALRASKYRIARVFIGGRRVNSILDRRHATGGGTADGGPTLPEVYRGDCCSSMSLACAHAHLNSGITTARYISVRSVAQMQMHPWRPGLPGFRAYE
jgi:hypothetical protein